MKHRVIGIDLGTTYCAVAAYDPDELGVEVIEDEHGNATTPSVVSYDGASGKVFVGWPAKQNLPNAPGDTIIEIKREMGEQEGGGEGARDGQDKVEDRPPVMVRFASLPREAFLPQEISAFVLMKMKEIAEAEIGEEVRDAVITVPAYFKEPKRAATEQAALLAGLYPRQLLPEPTAAAIAYGVDKGDPERHAYLVFDLGGGTFDVSIITSEAEKIEVIATTGDPRLGGGDFDNAITRWAVEQLKTEYGLDVGTDPRARAQIKFHAEEAKIRLGAQQSTDLVLHELRPSEPPVLTLRRDHFLELIKGDLRKSLDSVEEALKLAANKGLAKEDIDAVLLVGGSTKMPEVRAMLLDHFQKDESFIRGDLDPAAVVARGAAIVGYRLQPTEHPFDIRRPVAQGAANPEAELALGLDIGFIAEHSLGVGVQENRCVRMIERQTSLPTSRTQEGFTNGAPVERLEARVFQGEEEYTFGNTYIGSVVIDGLEPKPPGSYNFDVTYRLNRSGLLEVSVKDAESGRTWDARFEHGASVKSEDLLDKHERLKGLYAGRGPAPPAEAPAADTYVPPPPSPTPVQEAPQPAAAAPTPVQEAPQPATPAPATSGDGPSPAGAPGTETTELVEVELEQVPAEFRTYVRRARRQLERGFDARLASAFNDFAAAVNAKASEDDLADLGDTLTEALDDARRSAP